MAGFRGRGGESLWDNEMVSGIAFHPRKCRKSSSADGPGGRWIDSELKLNDGVQLAYRIYCGPRSRSTEVTRPVVLVYFHANAELCTDLEMEIDQFFECGFCAVVCPEFRGYAWSTGRPKLGALGPDAEIMMQALPQLLKDIELEGAEDAAVLVHGRSLGSICAVHVAATMPDKIAGVVVESGVVSLLELPMVRQLGAMMPEILQALASEPDPIGSIDKLRHISMPALFIHGDQDEISPVSQAVKAHKACSSSVKKLVRHPRCHHNDLHVVAGRNYFKELGLMRQVAAGDVPAEALTETQVQSSSFMSFFGNLRCFPAVKRCLTGNADV